MKNSALTLTEAFVYDNKKYISGNIAEYLINNTKELEFGYYFFLTEEEIDLFEKSSEKKIELIKNVNDFILENFNYEIEDKKNKFNIETYKDSVYVCSNDDFEINEAIDFLTSNYKLHEKCELIEENDTAVASYLNYKYAVIFHLKNE